MRSRPQAIVHLTQTLLRVTLTLARSPESEAEARAASRSATIATTARSWAPSCSRHDWSSVCSCATTVPYAQGSTAVEDPLSGVPRLLLSKEHAQVGGLLNATSAKTDASVALPNCC